MAMVLLTDEQLEALLQRAVGPLRAELAAVRAELRRLETPHREEKPGHIDIVRLAERLGKNRSTIGRWTRAGQFPRPHYCGGLRCWRTREIEAWETSRPMSRAPAERRRAG